MSRNDLKVNKILGERKKEKEEEGEEEGKEDGGKEGRIRSVCGAGYIKL